MRGSRSWSRLFSGTCSHSRIWSSLLFLRVWSLISVRTDRTWMTPSCWTGGPDYGPVSTWYRSRSVFLDRDYSVSRFPGSVETCSFAWLVAPVLRVIPSNSSSLARAAEKTGPSGCCPGTMTTVHSNVHKHRATKRVRLTFGSHFEIFPVSFSRRKEKTGPSGGRCCRVSLPLLLSTSGLINARPQSMHPVSLWLFARRGLTTLPFANFVIFWKNELAF